MKVVMVLGLLFSALSAQGLPRQVILIRHAEKPFPIEGSHLSEKGYARARALVSFFKTHEVVNRYGPISAIFAMKPKNEGGSVRAMETVEPTASAFSVPIRDQFKKNEIELLVQELLSSQNFDGKTVLVCWEHKMIPLIAHALGAEEAPQDWSSAVFDRAWILQFRNDGSVGFMNIPEHVLPGDSLD